MQLVHEQPISLYQLINKTNQTSCHVPQLSPFVHAVSITNCLCSHHPCRRIVPWPGGLAADHVDHGQCRSKAVTFKYTQDTRVCTSIVMFGPVLHRFAFFVSFWGEKSLLVIAPILSKIQKVQHYRNLPHMPQELCFQKKNKGICRYGEHAQCTGQQSQYVVCYAKVGQRV